MIWKYTSILIIKKKTLFIIKNGDNWNQIEEIEVENFLRADTSEIK